MGRNDSSLLDLMARLRDEGRPFALATVVRTALATSAKAGAKAVVTADGEIHGWIGGGCARAAVRRAALQSLAEGQARLISVQPQEELDSEGLSAGEERGGVEFHRSSCPSGGTLDIFVEPMLPRPQLVVCGGSPVALAIADLAARSGFSVTAAALGDDLEGFTSADRQIEGFDLRELGDGERFVVVATQGKRDLEALRAAVGSDAAYIAFVGSRKKAERLTAKLRDEGLDRERLARLRAPAGLDIGAITPEEIALSIIAEVVELRRRGSRRPAEPGAQGNHDAA